MGFTVELIVFAAIVFVVGYTVSEAQIHQVGARLADSLASTVLTRVSEFMNTTETALIVTAASGAAPGTDRLPTDEVGNEWAQRWLLQLRTGLYATQFTQSDLSVIFNDGGLASVGTWWTNASWVYSFVADPRSLGPELPCPNCTYEERFRRQKQRGNVTVRDVALFNRWTGAAWDPAAGPGFYPFAQSDQRVAAYYYSIAILSDTPPLQTPHGNARCYWSSRGFRTFTLPGTFLLEGVCAVINASGTLLGLATAELTTADVDAFLVSAVTTPGTVMVIVDTHMYIAASSYAAPFTRIYNATPDAPPALRESNGCYDSLSYGPLWPQRIGCRMQAADYAYGPLQEVARSDPGFLVADGREQRYGTLAGAAYFYVSARIPSQFAPSYGMNLVLFLPEVDVQGSSLALMVTSLTLCGVLCASGAAFANMMLHVMLRPDKVRASRQRRQRLVNPCALQEMYAAVLSSVRWLTSELPRNLVWQYAAAQGAGGGRGMPRVEGSVCVVKVSAAPGGLDDAASLDGSTSTASSWVSANDVYETQQQSLGETAVELRRMVGRCGGFLEPLGGHSSHVSPAIASELVVAVFTGAEHTARAVRCAHELCAAAGERAGHRAVAGVDSGLVFGEAADGTSAYLERLRVAARLLRGGGVSVALSHSAAEAVRGQLPTVPAPSGASQGGAV